MIDIPLSEIPLELTTLSETWISKLSIGTVTQHGGLPINHPTWKCAVNFEHKVIFTQLLTGSLMRDFYYEYLLAIGDKLIIISWEGGETSIKKVGAFDEFEPSELKSLINRCTELLLKENFLLVIK